MKPEEIANIGELHSPRRRMWKDGRWREDMCSRCRTTHPCPTARLIKHIEEQNIIIARLSNIPR